MADTPALAMLVVKVTVVLSLGLLCLRLAARKSAAFRHVIASTTLAATALLPLAAACLPAVAVVWTTRDIEASVVVPAAANGTLPLTSSIAPEPRLALPIVLMTGWVAGASLCLLPLVAVGYQSRRIRRHAQAWGVTEVTVPTLRGRHRRSVPVVVCDGLRSPVVCGLVSGVIALPMAATMWSRQDIQRALAHERAHMRRLDVLVQAVARVVCAAYWFHPLMWICWRRLRLEAERACDDAVLTHFEPADYAAQLVRIARGVTSDFASQVLPAMARPGELATRVEAILDAGRSRSTPRLGHAVLAVVVGVAAAACIACLTPTTAYAVRQSSPPHESFAAAVVTEHTAAGPTTLVRLPDGSVEITAATLQTLLRLAYGEQAHAIVDTPAWTATTRYDIRATPARPAPPAASLSMLRALLAQRFGLRVARESRVQRVIVIDLPASAPGLQPATPCTSTPTPALYRVTGTPPRCGFDVRPGQIRATAVDADALAGTLATAFRARVLVESARSGLFDLRLQWTPTGGKPLPLIESLRTQAGATVSEQERRVPVLAIKAVHQPT